MDAVSDLGNVRYLLSCTAPLSSQVILEFYHRYGMPICQHYGSSETGAVALHIPAAVLQHLNSVGTVMRGVSLDIVDANGSTVPAGVEGEIVVRSGAVSSGYLGKPHTSLCFSNGSFKMGDR